MKWVPRVPAIVALLLVLNGLPWSGRAEDARWGRAPAQFYRPLAAELHLGSADVLGIAHNAGNRAPSSALALAHGADVIEIDVSAIDGRLYAAHTPPPGWFPTSAYRGPTLDEAWARSAGARFVQLDLKETSAETMRLVLAFLDEHAGDRRVFLSTRNIAALELVSEQSPDVVRLLSIGNRFRLQALLEDPDRAELLHGVSIRAELLDAETMAWFKDRGLLVVAWTVNEVAQLNALVALGIDAVSTDNLAILDAMHWAEKRRDAALLGRLFP
jgi:glycerophosphoryl diester phosphodiesterase